MYHPRFDFALLSLFTHEELGQPFTVTKIDDDLWYVFNADGRELLGSVRYSSHTGCFVSYKVQFIAATRPDHVG